MSPLTNSYYGLWLLSDPLGKVDYSVVFTTPYILFGQTAKDWEAFFERNNIVCSQLGYQTRLDAFMKYGPSIHYWHEYIFLAYSRYRQNAVFLTGIPDIKATLPHA